MKNLSRQLEAIYGLSKAIVGAQGVEDVCGRIVKTASDILNVDKVSIMKLDRSDNTLKIVASKGLSKKTAAGVQVRIGEGISGSVFKSSRPVLIRDIGEKGLVPKKRYKSKSLMSAPVTCFPMKVKGRAVGVINVTDKRDKRPFTEDDMNLLNAIANQTAAYLYICDLAETERKAEILNKELELARGIQQRLLPTKVPQIAGVDICGVCITAEKVGGDYFDFLTGGARTPTVVVADISGHSLSSAMTMGAVRSAVRSGAFASMFSPSIAVEGLNAILYEDLRSAEQFLSMVLMHIFAAGDKKVVKYTTAGHHPPLILKKGGFISHSTDDILIGIERFADYHDRKIEMEKGDIIALYTDGLIDAFSAANKRYGLERLKIIIKNNRGGSASELVELVKADLKKFIGKIPLKDDVTLVILKF